MLPVEHVELTVTVGFIEQLTCVNMIDPGNSDMLCIHLRLVQHE